MNDCKSARLTKNSVSLVTATLAVVIGLSACGKFSVIDPKAKGTSTNSNPLSADEENRLRDLVATPSPTPTPVPGAPAATGDGALIDDRDAALDEARRVFGAELDGRPAQPASDLSGQPASPPATGSTPQPAADPAAAAVVLTTPPAQAPSPSPSPAASSDSKALIAADITDEAKRDLILALVEPTMRINFNLSLQRNEILALKKILDSKKELSTEQAAKLSKFKQSYLLIDADSIDDLLARVDVVNFTLQTAPLILKTNWQTNGQFSQEDVATRVQMVNTYPSDEAVRFRSGRLAVKGLGLKRTSKQIMTAELGYNPSSNKDENAEKVLATIDETLRIMELYSTEFSKKNSEVSAMLVEEHNKKK